jgi:hypothetical protein
MLGLLAACGNDAESASTVVVDTLPGGIPRTISSAPVDSGKWQLEFERDLMPAADSPGELLEPNSAAIADDGTMYVADNKPAQIRVYGADGNFIRNIGREGTGPGEYQSPFVGLRGDTLVIQDPQRTSIIIYRASTGEVLRTLKSVCCYWFPVSIDGAGNAVAYMNTPPDSTLGSVQAFFRANLATGAVDTLMVPKFEEPADWPKWQLGDGERMIMRMSVPLQPRPHYAVDPTGGIVAGFSSDFRFAMTTNGRDTTAVFGRSYQPIPVTASEKSTLVDAAVASMLVNNQDFDEVTLRKQMTASAIPDQRPPYEALMIDGAGRRWVRLSSNDTTVVKLDLFDRDGRWLDQLTVPAEGWPKSAWMAPAFSRDRVAVQLETDDGLPFYRVYRIVRR